MKKSNGVIYIPSGKPLPNLPIDTRWDVNDRGVCQQALIGDPKTYNEFASIKSVYVSFHFINNRHGEFLRVFSGVALANSEAKKISFLEINSRMKNLFLATLIERKEYILQFINTETEYMRELVYPLTFSHLSILSRCYESVSRVDSKKLDFELAKDELEKQYPISKEIQDFRKFYLKTSLVQQ